MVGRFELAPMVFAFAAARWWFAGRNVLGGLTAGLGTLMKVFPGLVAVPALVWEVSQLRRPGQDPPSPQPSPLRGEGGRRPGEGSDDQERGSPDPAAGPTCSARVSRPRRGRPEVSPPRLLSAPLSLTRVRGTATFFLTMVLGMAGWLLLGGPNVLDSFRYHAARGLGIESLYAGALLAWGKLAGIDIPWVLDHKAIHLAPGWGSLLAEPGFCPYRQPLCCWS